MTPLTRSVFPVPRLRCLHVAASVIALAIGPLSLGSAPDWADPLFDAPFLRTAPAAAHPLFSAPFLAFDTGSAPYSVATADLNGDGRPDLATANYNADTVSVLLGNGDGTFGPRTDFATALYPASVAIGEFNGDGNADLVTANIEGTISVLMGNGDGTFSPKTDYGTGAAPTSVVIADLNADGNADLATANRSSDTVSVLLGEGNGAFAAKMDFGTGTMPQSVSAEDLDRDGVTDLAVTNSGTYPDDLGSVSVLLGNGDGTFGAKTDYGAEKNSRSVAVGDWNGDENPDLAVINLGAFPSFLATVSVLLGNGDGSFGTKTDFATRIFPSAVASGDFDGDGDSDLVTTNRASGGGVSVLLGNGDGSFAPSTDFETSPGTASVAIGDFDRDGTSDLAIANTDLFGFGIYYYPTGTVSVLLGNGDGSFGTKTAYGTGGYSRSIAIGDLNGDGRPDLATANSGVSPDYLGSVSVLLENEDGTFGEHTDYATGVYSMSVAIGDLDGDGNPDLAAANYYSDTASVLLGNGDGTFAARMDFDAGGNPRSVVIGDLNRDSIPDLVTSNVNEYDPNGGGDVCGGCFPEAPAWGIGTVSVLLGNGDGTFGPRMEYETQTNPGTVAIDDVNSDGSPDLVTANSGPRTTYAGTASVLLGNGDGTFGAKTDYATGIYSRSVAIGDLDGDGNSDLAVANSGAPDYLSHYPHGTVSVLLGNGDGTFGAKTDYGTSIYSRSVAIADVDGDGDRDLAVANNDAKAVSVLLGNGDGTFGAKTDYGTGYLSQSIAIGDLNWDGKPDLATANYGTVSVLLAQSCIPTSVQLQPQVLNLRSQARWVSVILEPPSPYAPSDIDISSILLAGPGGSISPDPNAPVAVGDADGDGIADLLVKFVRSDVIGLLQTDMTELRVTGNFIDRCFEGQATLRMTP